MRFARLERDASPIHLSISSGGSVELLWVRVNWTLLFCNMALSTHQWIVEEATSPSAESLRQSVLFRERENRASALTGRTT